MLALPEVPNVLADIPTRVPDTVLGHWPSRDSTLVMFEIPGACRTPFSITTISIIVIKVLS